MGQKLTLDDIEEFDEGLVAQLKDLLAVTDEDEFSVSFGDRVFTTVLSDESTVEVEEGGASRTLTMANRVEYARKTLYTRFKECQQQCEAIKRGICQIVPEALLNMVSYQELEEWIYGKKTVDVELLRAHTEYGGESGGYSETQQEIIWFWEILEEMSQDYRRQFVRFCLAQSTLPPTDEEWRRSSLRFLVRTPSPPAAGKPQLKGPPDSRLPTASTCFFNFELPRYSSKASMKK